MNSRQDTDETVAGDAGVLVRYTSWRPLATSISSVLGVGVSIYLTLAHYSASVSIACPATSAINCEKVTTSAQSYVFHIPVAVLGLAFFIPMLVLCLPRTWRSPSRLVAQIRLGMAIVGIGFVLYLVHAELFDIHAICLWCTSVHILTFIVFLAVVTGWDEGVMYANDEAIDAT